MILAKLISEMEVQKVKTPPPFKIGVKVKEFESHPCSCYCVTTLYLLHFTVLQIIVTPVTMICHGDGTRHNGDSRRYLR